MKIGIVSLIDTQQNYGQLLQCYAMQRVMARLGHQAFHLKYVETKRSTLTRIKNFAMMTLLGATFHHLKKRKENVVIPGMTVAASVKPNERGFDDFRRRYVRFSEKTYTIDQLCKEAPEADVWVTGSDQVWGRGAHKLFHLQFAPKGSKVLSYAASMGGYRLDDNYKRHYFRKYLKRFDYISLREVDGLEECRSIGYGDAQLVPDPTFLLEADEYRRISRLPAIADNCKYVFLYLLGNPVDVEVKSIFRWAEGKGLKVIYVASQGRLDDYAKYMASPEEWLGLIDNAEAVVTNSFHGMAMSLIFGKRFLALPVAGALGRMNGRITTTLQEFGLGSDRIYSGNLDNALTDYDIDSVKEAIDAVRSKVMGELDQILRK